MFVAAGSSFDLAAVSPARGAGSSSVGSLVTTNFSFVAWGTGPFDIGAY